MLWLVLLLRSEHAAQGCHSQGRMYGCLRSGAPLRICASVDPCTLPVQLGSSQLTPAVQVAYSYLQGENTRLGRLDDETIVSQVRSSAHQTLLSGRRIQAGGTSQRRKLVTRTTVGRRRGWLSHLRLHLRNAVLHCRKCWMAS